MLAAVLKAPPTSLESTRCNSPRQQQVMGSASRPRLLPVLPWLPPNLLPDDASATCGTRLYSAVREPVDSGVLHAAFGMQRRLFASDFTLLSLHVWLLLQVSTVPPVCIPPKIIHCKHLHLACHLLFHLWVPLSEGLSSVVLHVNI